MSDGARHGSGSWEVEIGALGEYFRGKKTLQGKELVLLSILILLFSGVAFGVVAKASGYRLLTGSCTGAVSPYPSVRPGFHILLVNLVRVPRGVLW